MKQDLKPALEPRKRAQWGEAKLKFSALAQDILRELEKHPVTLKSVYAKYRDRLGISYAQFCFWVRRHQAFRRRDDSTAQSVNLENTAHRTPAPSPKGGFDAPQEKKGFEFNPMDAITKNFM